MNRFLIVIGCISSLIWGFIAWMSKGLPESYCQKLDHMTGHIFSKEIMQMANGFYYDVNNNDMPTVIFILFFTVVFVLYWQCILKLEKSAETKQSLLIVIIFAVLFRLALFVSEPIHENDFYRYLWDGKVSAAGINPYKYAPADLFMFEENIEEDYFDEYHEVNIAARNWNAADYPRLTKLLKLRNKQEVYYNRIGHWQVPTIYPPVAQWIFSLSAWIKADSILLLKGILLLFDMGVIFLIVSICRHVNIKSSFCLVYAWSPLVIKEVANAIHYDPIATFFTVLAVWFFLKRKMVSSTLGVGLATLSKLYSGVLFPILMRSMKKRSAAYFIGIITLAYVPYYFWNQTSVNEIFQGLSTYNEQWAYNASVFAIVYLLYEKLMPFLAQSYFPAKLTVGIGYLIILCCLSFKRPKDDIDLLRKCFWAIALLFLLNPVGDPWYFTWSLPFLCIFRYRAWILLSGLLMISYLSFHNDLGWLNTRFFDIAVISWIIYVPFFILLLIDKFRCQSSNAMK